MTKTILKRIALPRTWSIPRKSFNGVKEKFVSRPNAGKSYDLSVSINTFLKDIVKVANTKREVKYIIRYKEVLLNGASVTDEKMPVGLFDVVELPQVKQYFRLTLSENGKLDYAEVNAKDKDTKIKKVVGKTILGKDKVQINLFGSDNIISSESVSVGDVILIKDKKIESVLNLDKDSTVFLIAGRHAGSIGVVKEIKENQIFLDVDGSLIETSKQYAYVIADKKTKVQVR